MTCNTALFYTRFTIPTLHIDLHHTIETRRRFREDCRRILKGEKEAISTKSLS